MILATDRCHVLEDPWGDRAVAIRFDQPEASADILAGLEVDAIVGVGDRPSWIAAMGAEKLGIPFHPAIAVRAAGDKQLSRRLLGKVGLPVPENYQIGIDERPQGARFYPCVLKPLGLSASRGVIRANDDAELQAAFVRIRAILESPEIKRLAEARDRLIQVERFIEGREFALEGLVTQGTLRTLAIFDKPDPLDGPFFEETIYVTPSRETEDRQRAMVDAAQRAVTALGLTHGPVHTEMRVNEHGIFILEVAARPIGGLCSRAVKFAGGQTLEDVILLHATGSAVPERPASAAAVMMIPIPRGGVYDGVDGLEAARSTPGIEDVLITAKPGQQLFPLPEGSSYLGFLFARGEWAESAVREAHAKLKFRILGVLPITRPAKE
jgi:biotin carboxylase